MKKNTFVLSIVIVLFALAFVTGCERTEFTTNPEDKLQFSNDTVQFDTIFQGIGSTTRFFIVYNQNSSKSIQIDRVFLAGGGQSKFRLNINGYQSNELTDIAIAPGDSLFIFVEVTINPETDAMVEQDSVVFVSNGNIQDVDLIAFGQNVLLIDGQVFSNDTVITSNKPVLVYNSMLVDSLATLTIMEGVKFHFHKNSSLLVKGTLKVFGTVANPVYFTGDRLEQVYSEIPGQWGAYLEIDSLGITYLLGGIHLLDGSRFNEIENTVIKNGIIGLRVDNVVTPGTPCLVMKNTRIENMNVAGLYAAGTHIESYNCVFANCGKYTIACTYGGNYAFYHCTMANFWSGNRQAPQLVLNNYYVSGSTLYAKALEKAYFGNCIIYGNRDQELLIDLSDETVANYFFDRCLLKVANSFNTSNNTYFKDVIRNENPNFVSTTRPYDYSLDSISPALNIGDPEISAIVPFDFNGNSRISDDGPDLGAIEKTE